MGSNMFPFEISPSLYHCINYIHKFLFLPDASEIYCRGIKAVDLRHWRILEAIQMQQQAILNS
jgi:hypothetical protein